LNIFFWDIDGTLIRTNKAGLYAFEQATAELWQSEFDFHQIETAGMTDNYIAAQIIKKITGREADEQEIITLTERYEQLLPGHLTARGGRIMPSVHEILARLEDRADCLSLLLTGNSRSGSEVKLEYFELARYFDFSRSAFCDRHFNRLQIANCAASAIQNLRKTETAVRIFVIGDTPHDIRCGQSIQAYTIGVATGGFTVAELEACSPWWAVTALPPAGEFMQKLELA
jgi:phosphoglycolate phosphatase-like HAD superfamily hydrolase